MTRPPQKALAALAAALLLFVPACGKKGPLRPPLRLVPQTAEGLRASQRGARIILEWTQPDAYNDGSRLDGIAAVEVWEGAAPDDFPASARLVRSLTTAELEPLRTAAAPAPASYALAFVPSGPGPAGGAPRLYALRVVDARRKRASDFTPPAALHYVPVPLPPTGVTAEVEESRIVLRWTPPATNADGTKPPALGGYRVYRSEGGGGARRLNDKPLSEPRLEDADFAFGRAYRYVIRAVAATEETAESEDAVPFDIEPRDVFPPAVPAGLTAAAGGTVITLLWDPNREPDLAGYKVWRRQAGQTAWTLLTPVPGAGNAYTDLTPAKNVRYEYAVAAVDTAGNEGPRCAPASEIVKEGRP
jgi:predicted small lipoprotein YifL